jgi:hypothetical protein
MRNAIAIDRIHTYAIVREIGERLRPHLREEPDVPDIFRKKIDRLRELEEWSPSIFPDVNSRGRQNKIG